MQTAGRMGQDGDTHPARGHPARPGDAASILGASDPWGFASQGRDGATFPGLCCIPEQCFRAPPPPPSVSWGN